MVYQLLQRDPAWKTALRVAPLFALGGLFVHPGIAASPALIAVACFSAGVLQTGDLLTRSSLFYAALPISGRQMFLARAIACVSLAALPYGAAAAAYWLAYPADPRTALALLTPGVVLAAFTLCAFSLRLPEFSPPTKLKSFLLWLAVLPCSVLFLPAVVLPILATATLGILVRWMTVWPRVPESFQAAPLEAAKTRTRTDRGRAPASPSAWWALVRTSIPWQAWMMMPIVLVWSVVLHPFISMLFGVNIFANIRQRIRWLHTLPIHPRTLLVLILLPYLLPLVGGYEVAAHFGPARSVTLRLTIDEASGKSSVDVPLEYWRRAPSGIAPVIQAPWGETFEPPVESTLGLALYNPYASGPANSDGFVHWQYARAAEVIYGRSLAFRQVQDGLRNGSIVPILVQGRGQILGTALLLALAMVLQGLVSARYWYKLPAPWGRKAMGLVFLVAFLAALGTDFWLSTRRPGALSTALFNSLVLHALRWTPESIFITLAVAALLIAVPYAWLGRQFRGSEVIGSIRPAGQFGQVSA